MANTAFCISTIIWIFAEAVYAHTLPFALITYPGLFITVILLGIYMNDLKVIWSGRFEDPEFLNNENYQQLLKKTNTSQILGEEDLEGLKYRSSMSHESPTPSVLKSTTKPADDPTRQA